MASTDDTTQTQIRFPRALWEQLRARAVAEHRSANNLVVLLIDEALRGSVTPRRNRQAVVK